MAKGWHQTEEAKKLISIKMKQKILTGREFGIFQILLSWI